MNALFMDTLKCLNGISDAAAHFCVKTWKIEMYVTIATKIIELLHYGFDAYRLRKDWSQGWRRNSEGWLFHCQLYILFVLRS